MAKQKADKTLSDRIRAAALGPVPSHTAWAMTSWIGLKDLRTCIRLFSDHPSWDAAPFWSLDNNADRRMALLFLAEAVK